MLSKALFLASELFVLFSALIQSIFLRASDDLSDFWEIALMGLIALNIILIIAETKKFIVLLQQTIPRTRTQAISEYLLNWIKSGRRIAIVSRDLSWVKDNIKDELLKKAKDGELIVFLPKSNAVSHELMAAGAEVKYYMYGTENVHVNNRSISSRFIIAGYESTPRVTTPIISKELHINQEYTPDEFSTKITSDIVDIMRANTHKTIPFGIKDKNAISRHLEDWLRNGGRCFILTRDLSWADDDNVKNCLLEKSAKGEIVIFMQKETTVSAHLHTQGADVRYYENFNYTFKNRFIISHWGTTVSKLTIPAVQGDAHVNHIYDSSHRIYAYATEMAEFLNNLMPNNGPSPSP